MGAIRMTSGSSILTRRMPLNRQLIMPYSGDQRTGTEANSYVLWGVAGQLDKYCLYAFGLDWDFYYHCWGSAFQDILE
jgi:hypothetical protein